MKDIENYMLLGHENDPHFDRPAVLGNCENCGDIVFEGNKHEETINDKGQTIYFCDSVCEENWRNE